MKPTLRTISPRKFHRLFNSRRSKLVKATRFNEKTWECSPLFPAFVFNGFLYFAEKTKEKQYHLVYKKVNVENTHKGLISYYVS